MARASGILAALALLAAPTRPVAGQGVPGWLTFVGGVITSIASHESAHVLASIAMGGTPSFGFDRSRPVIYSGINPTTDPHRQFVFSASGMSTQLLLNEVLLDWPHSHGGRAGAFERGLLAGGVGTVVFYFTIGRNASVSDVDQMARYSGLDKWSLTAIFGGVAATDVIRIMLNDRYGPHFFALPGPDRTVQVGANLRF